MRASAQSPTRAPCGSGPFPWRPSQRWPRSAAADVPRGGAGSGARSRGGIWHAARTPHSPAPPRPPRSRPRGPPRSVHNTRVLLALIFKRLFNPPIQQLTSKRGGPKSAVRDLTRPRCTRGYWCVPRRGAPRRARPAAPARAPRRHFTPLRRYNSLMHTPLRRYNSRMHSKSVLLEPSGPPRLRRGTAGGRDRRPEAALHRSPRHARRSLAAAAARLGGAVRARSRARPAAAADAPRRGSSRASLRAPHSRARLS